MLKFYVSLLPKQKIAQKCNRNKIKKWYSKLLISPLPVFKTPIFGPYILKTPSVFTSPFTDMSPQRTTSIFFLWKQKLFLAPSQLVSSKWPYGALCICVLLVRATHGPQDHYTYLSLLALLRSVELDIAFHLINEFHQHHFLYRISFNDVSCTKPTNEMRKSCTYNIFD